MRNFAVFEVNLEAYDSNKSLVENWQPANFETYCRYAPRGSREFNRAGQVDDKVIGLLMIRGSEFTITQNHRATLATGEVLYCLPPTNPDQRDREIVIQVVEHTPNG